MLEMTAYCVGCRGCEMIVKMVTIPNRSDSWWMLMWIWMEEVKMIQENARGVVYVGTSYTNINERQTMTDQVFKRARKTWTYAERAEFVWSQRNSSKNMQEEPKGTLKSGHALFSLLIFVELRPVSQQLASHFLSCRCFPGTLFNFILDTVMMKAKVKTLLSVQSTNPQARIYLKQAPPCWSLILSAFQVALFSFLSLHLQLFLFCSSKGHTFTSHLCVSVLVAAGVSAWMTVPPRGIWPPRLLASVCATPRTTSASCSMARTLHSATKLMWVLSVIMVPLSGTLYHMN